MALVLLPFALLLNLGCAVSLCAFLGAVYDFFESKKKEERSEAFEHIVLYGSACAGAFLTTYIFVPMFAK